MRTILRKTFLLSVMTVFAISTAMAQPKSNDIEPGSKGELPALPDPPSSVDNVLPILQLEMVTGEYLLSGTFYNQILLRFPEASTLGGDYYELEYKSSREDDYWKRYTDSDETRSYRFEGDNAALILGYHIDYGANEFRLYLYDEEGEERTLKGISNVVTFPYITPLHCFLETLDHSWAIFVGAGIPLYNCKAYVAKFDEENKKHEYDENCEYYVYQWYRRNPNTYEMTLIQGETGKVYTPTIEDVGYEIVKVVMGDNQNLGFYGAFCDGIVKMPIEASIEYIDRDGFVLNTSYVLPNGGKGLCYSAEPGNPDSESIPFPEGSIRELKPGQYAVSMKKEQYEGRELRYEDDRYRVSFLYEFPDWQNDGEIKTTYREAQIMPDRYQAPLMVKTLCGEEVVNGTVDIIGKNWEDKLEVVATMTTEELQSEELLLPAAQQYYVKIRKTDNTLETYYPNALSWEDAKPIEPKMYDGSDNWHVTTALIEVQPGFEPLQGKGKIKGKITKSNNSARAKIQKAEGEETIYSVYLKDNSNSKLIAMTETDAEGNYLFENVPVGSYSVIPNVEGYKAETAASTQATITEENLDADVDCVMIEVDASEIFPDEKDELLLGDADKNGSVDTKDITVILDYLMDKKPDTFSFENADANSDKIVNVADIIQIVNIILNK